MGKTDRFKVIFIILLTILFGQVDSLLAQQVTFQNTANGEFFILKAADGREIRLAAQTDDDEDGIENALEINGFTYSPTDGLQPWDGDESKTYFKTDPLRWSTDGDPYSDFMEVSGVNMPAGVPSPENKPLVAARPIINIGMWIMTSSSLVKSPTLVFPCKNRRMQKETIIGFIL